jgi:3-oxoadipate enol-lactonase
VAISDPQPALVLPDGIVGERHGEGDLLIWLHGLSSSRAIEDESDLLGPGAPQGFSILRYDAPGHGASARVTDDERTTWPRLGTLFGDVAHLQANEPVVAAGASMGTATSLWAATQAPEIVRALVLVIPPTAFETRAAQRELYLEAADLVERSGMAAYLRAQEVRPLVPSLEEEGERRRAISRRHLARVDPTSFAHVLRGAAASNFPSRDAIRALAVPTLICAWEGDPQHPVSTSEELVELIPDARLVVAKRLADIRAWRGEIEQFCEGLG